MARTTNDLPTALIRCARAARLSMRPADAVMVIEKYSLMVAIKGVGNDDPADVVARQRGAEFRVMLRVDAEAARAAGQPTDKAIDRFLMRQEGALNVLLTGDDPPFDPRKLRLSIVLHDATIGDAWVRHIVTRDRYRVSMWEVTRRIR